MLEQKKKQPIFIYDGISELAVTDQKKLLGL